MDWKHFSVLQKSGEEEKSCGSAKLTEGRFCKPVSSNASIDIINWPNTKNLTHLLLLTGRTKL